MLKTLKEMGVGLNARACRQVENLLISALGDED